MTEKFDAVVVGGPAGGSSQGKPTPTVFWPEVLSGGANRNVFGSDDCVEIGAAAIRIALVSGRTPQ